jgi:hypothetical protein
MKLEYLANELLFDIFDYMSIGQIFQSFHSSLNQLIFVYLRLTRHLDLRFMSLSDFKIFYQSQLHTSKSGLHSFCACHRSQKFPPEC